MFGRGVPTATMATSMAMAAIAVAPLVTVTIAALAQEGPFYLFQDLSQDLPKVKFPWMFVVQPTKGLCSKTFEKVC